MRDAETTPPMALDQLMLQFESLGDNCEFGLVQRKAGAEPISLLRFSGFHIPIEHRLDRLVSALSSGFDRLGEPETIRPCLAGEPGRKEWLVQESAFDLRYHTFQGENAIAESALRERESKRLVFLRRKLLADLGSGEKIWVWRSEATSGAQQVKPLYDQLRRMGPNQLLWVVAATDPDVIGTVELLNDGFAKGYVERFAPYAKATDISPEAWFQMCREAHCLLRPASMPKTHPSPVQPLTAMDHLRKAAAEASVIGAAPSPPPRGIIAWLRGLFDADRRQAAGSAGRL